MVMALLRTHDTQVAFRQTSEARVTISLTEAFFSGSFTVDALNVAREAQRYRFAEIIIKRNFPLTEHQKIVNRLSGHNPHFSQMALFFHWFECFIRFK